MATPNGILCAWPTAAAYLQGARPVVLREEPLSRYDEPLSRYRTMFKAKYKAVRLEATLKGERASKGELLGRVNARLREENAKRVEAGEKPILNSWNTKRASPQTQSEWKKERTPKRSCRLDGDGRKRTSRAGGAAKPSSAGAAKPSSAGARGAAAAPADTCMATATATVTPAVGADTFVLSNFLGSPAPPSATSGELLLGGGSSVAGAEMPNAAACGGEEPAAEPSPAGSEFCLSMFLP